MDEKHIKRTAAIAVILLILFAALYIAFGKGVEAQRLRQGISMSLEEDFKIKESLGQVFLVQGEEGSQEVNSGNVSVTGLIRPADGYIHEVSAANEAYLEVECGRFNGVYAVADGKVESCENGRITLRHSDGKLSVYSGCGSLTGQGKQVKQGDVIGYVDGLLTYRLYENCVALNPMDYIRE